METLDTLTIILLVTGAILGQVTHIVKVKSTRSSEMAVFRRWILKRPFTTLSAAVVAVGAAYAIQTAGMDPVQIFALAFIAGYSADSGVNRPATEEE